MALQKTDINCLVLLTFVLVKEKKDFDIHNSKGFQAHLFSLCDDPAGRAQPPSSHDLA